MSAHAQTEIGAQLDLFSSYVWRGVTLTNKPVLQPDVWVSFPAGNASITAGGWANIDIGKYDDPDDDISESGGLSAFNFAEFNPYAEVSFGTGKATLTGGIIGYIYPNDTDDGLNSDFNTWEFYGKVGFDVPLAPEFSRLLRHRQGERGLLRGRGLPFAAARARTTRWTWAG